MFKRLPTNLRWQEVANVLKKLEYAPTRQRGSHLVLANKQGKIVTVVMKSPVKHGTLEKILDTIGLTKEKFLEML